MNGIGYIYNIGTRAIALLAIFAFVGCVSDDYDCPITQSDGKVAVDLALNVSTSSATQGTTRMSPSAVKANALSVQDFHIVPFSIPSTQDSVLSTDVPTNDIITTFGKVGNYFLTDPLELKLGTNAFLCYAKAKPQGETANPTVDGALAITALPNGTHSPVDTRFNLKAIQEASTTPDAKAVKLLEYMNSIATAAPWPDNEFQLFINNGGGLAGSSRNIIAYVNEWYIKAGSIATIGPDIQAAIHSTEYVTLTDGKVTAIKGVDSYPNGLPDGAAVMTWNNDPGIQKFEYDEVHWDNTEDKYILISDNNKFADYVYPAERYFYANSRIYTSGQSRKTDYTSKATWNDVLNTYENKGTDNKGVLVDVTTRSVAIKNPLSYGVAGMEIHIKAKMDAEDRYLRDDDSKHETYDDSKVTLSASTATTLGTFPLTAVIIGSQVEQNYCFEPALPTDNTEKKEYAIYDTEVKGIKPSETSPTTVTLGDTDKDHYSAPVYTIGLQTKDELSLKVVLEFLNNSTKDFISENGVIYKGTKFYLVASVVPSGSNGIEKRVMTRGHMSTINLTISSLKSAYNALPDLSSDKLRLFDTVEAGIRKWQVGQTGEHEVYNW